MGDEQTLTEAVEHLLVQERSHSVRTCRTQFTWSWIRNYAVECEPTRAMNLILDFQFLAVDIEKGCIPVSEQTG